MGKVKLTLSVEGQIIIRAKQVANISKISLSKVIENFLVNDFLKNQEKKIDSLALKLRGIAKSELSMKNDKEIKALMLLDKHKV